MSCPSSLAGGAYKLLWNAIATEPEISDSDCDDIVEDYTATPLAAVYNLLEKKFNSEIDNEVPDDEGTWQGGVVHRIATSMQRWGSVKPALEVADASLGYRLRRRMPVSFVYDMLKCSVSFAELRFVSDAGRPPLGNMPDEEFESLYSIARRLRFRANAMRDPSPSDWWSQVY